MVTWQDSFPALDSEPGSLVRFTMSCSAGLWLECPMLERLITFIVLGFFVFVADFGSWWQTSSLLAWYSNFGLWLVLIVACYIATRDSGSNDA